MFFYWYKCLDCRGGCAHNRLDCSLDEPSEEAVLAANLTTALRTDGGPSSLLGEPMYDYGNLPASMARLIGPTWTAGAALARAGTSSGPKTRLAVLVGATMPAGPAEFGAAHPRYCRG